MTPKEIAQKESLSIVGTTDGEALIGLRDYAQAEMISEKYGLRIEIITRRNGERFWECTGDEAFGPLTINENDYASVYSRKMLPELEDIQDIQNSLKYADETEKEEILRDFNSLKEKIEGLEDGELLCVDYDGDYEVKQAESMEYYRDGKCFCIGLLF